MNQVVKFLLKTLSSQKNALNVFNPALSKPKKSKSQIDHAYYQNHKEKKKEQRRERYQQQKHQKKATLNKYYGAEAVKILMSLKEYTELNKEKRKRWLNFVWTFKDLSDWENERPDIHDIIQVMKLREEADNLITDYWTTAKHEVKKGKLWNSLDQEQKDRLIRYWSQEKVRKDKQLLSELEQQEQAGSLHQKAIELAKFHEERGKIKCPCYDCETKKELQAKIRQKLFKENKSDQEQCPECKKWVKELDEESGVCKNCLENYA